MSVKYCSEKCQVAHWTKSGHRKECTRLRNLYNERIVINESSTTKSIQSEKGPSFEKQSEKGPSFEKPSCVAFDEAFTLKVVFVASMDVLHIYDKTGECDFYVKVNETSGTTNSIKLLDKVKKESLTAGTAIHLAATFGGKRECSIYVNRRKVRAW